MTTNLSKPTVPYPNGLARVFVRFPIYLYRLGWGASLNWIPFMILTTSGRRSGQARHAVVEYRRHGSKYYVVSAWGENTQWYKNLLQNPHVTIQHGSHIYDAIAHKVENPAESLKALYMFSRNSLIYETLFARISSADSGDLDSLAEVANEFTVIRIDPTGQSPELMPIEPYARQTQILASGFILLSFLWLILRIVRRVIRL